MTARDIVEHPKKDDIANLSIADKIPFCPSKGGVNRLTKANGLSLVDNAILVNYYAPGLVLATPMELVVHNGRHSIQAFSR